MKDYFNQFRGSLPPSLIGRVEGVLMSDAAKLKKWQNWRSGLTWEDNALGVKLIGALDDCLTDGEIYIPLDNKTKGSKPKDDGSQYYQTQMDCYGLLLKSNGYKVNGNAFLVYYYPFNICAILENLNSQRELSIGLPFGVDVYCLKSSPDEAVATITKAVEILKGKRPEPAPDCEYCRFGLLYPRGENKQ